MENIEILEATWTEDHNGIHYEIMLDGKKASYYSIENDDAPVNKFLWEYAKKHLKKIKEHIPMEQQVLLPGQTRINGYIFNDADEKARMTLCIRERLNELYSGFEQAMAERHPTRSANRKRKIDNLLNADKHPNWPYIDIKEIEDGL